MATSLRAETTPKCFVLVDRFQWERDQFRDFFGRSNMKKLCLAAEETPDRLAGTAYELWKA